MKEYSELFIEDKINGDSNDGIKQMETEAFMAKRVEYGYKKIMMDKGHH